MFTKHVSELDYSDIEDLVNVRQEKEGYSLDYKLGFNNDDNLAGKDLAKDVSSFANSYGGYIIIGVDDNRQIKGVESIKQRKRIDEWINQVLNSNVEPQLFYYDPVVIPIPESDKVIVVIHIPESTKKPHFANEWHNYFIRINDRSKKANHNQIRDMFEFSRNRTDEFNEFLKKRNLFEEDSSNFGLNRNSRSIFNPTNEANPVIIFSLIPKYPNEEKAELHTDEFKSWLQRNNQGYKPCTGSLLYDTTKPYDVKIDGIVLKFERYQKGITSYFEVLNNGYIEAGFSNSFIQCFEMSETSQKQTCIFPPAILAYEMLLLGFAKRFYNYIKYYDEVLLQISFRNMLNIAISYYDSRIDGNVLYRPFTTNNQHENFKLNYRFNPNSINDNDIFDIVNNHANKIYRAFGQPKSDCFDEEGELCIQCNQLKL